MAKTIVEVFRRHPAAVLWWLVCVYTAASLYGFYGEDELGQITAFYLHKAGIVPAEQLPWEFQKYARPWFQPAVYYAFLAPVIELFGFRYLLLERLALLLDLLFVTAVMPAFLYLLGSALPLDSRTPYVRWGLATVASWWFLPSMIVRHSSEAFAMIFLVPSLALWHRIETGKATSISCYALLAGVLAGLSFLSRYQMGLFFAGFWVCSLVSREGRRRPGWSIHGLFLAGAACSLTLGFVIDWWGYGRPTATPWNYFYWQIVLDTASSFGRRPWDWYLPNVTLFTLNPLLFPWLVYASVVCWREPFYRSMTAGIAAFVVVHSITPHKELRFLLPMAVPAILLLGRMFAKGVEQRRNGRFWPAPAWYVKPVVVLNCLALVLFTLIGPVNYRDRIDLAIWKLPPGTIVYSATDLYHTFDEEPVESSRPENAFVALFRKPPTVGYVHVPVKRMAIACSEQPDAVLLLTSEQKGESAPTKLVDRAFTAIERFPPQWLAPAIAGRTERYKLVKCREYLLKS
jgi:phosphatidylinositol glycan class B